LFSPARLGSTRPLAPQVLHPPERPPDRQQRQAHAPDQDTPLEETLQAFDDLVRMGKTRYLGFSNFDHHVPLDARALAIQKARGWERFVSSQPRYNLIDRHVEKGHLALCRRNGVGLIVYSPLAQGVLTNKYAGNQVPEGSRATTTFAKFLTAEKALTPENVAAAERFAAWVASRGLGAPAPVALAWVLEHPEVSSAIIGATRTEQIDENLKALEVQLEPADWKAAEAAIAGRTAARTRRALRPTRRRRSLSRR